MIIGIEASHANKEKRTGVEEYCWQIIQNLKKQIPSDVRVILYSRRPLIAGLNNLPINWFSKVLPWIEKVPRRFQKGWSQCRLSWELRKNPPDVFFAPGQLVPFFCPKNTVVTVHDSAFLTQKESYWFMSRWYLRLMNALIVKKAKKILTPSEFSKNELVKFYNLDENKILITPLGYNKEVYHPSPNQEVLKKLNINKKFILSVGRLEKKKNTVNIIRAFDLLRKDFDCQLVLVGRPDVGYSEVDWAITNSPQRSDIIVPGWVDAQNIAALMSLAEVFVFPSLYEGFGIPVLEAMACGCPVVASRGNSLEEVGGEAALYVSPDDVREISEALKSVFSDSVLKQKMSESGLNRAKEFSWEKTAKSTWFLLSETGK